MRAITVGLLLLFAGPAFAQDRPLPDSQPFLQEVKKRLQADEARQSNYMYVETRKRYAPDKAGNPTLTGVRVFESYPALPGESRWRRRISEDGKPVPAAQLEKTDRERQKKVQEYLRKLEKQSDKERAADRDKKRREEAANVDDIFRVFDIRMLGREALEGHDTIAFSLTPRPGAKPQTGDGKMLRHFKGKAWVSESEYELVRMEIEALDTVSFGFGILARLHKGSRSAFQRRKVGEEWLPASASSKASARLLLFKRLQIEVTAEFTDYRKFTVATDTVYGRPK